MIVNFENTVELHKGLMWEIINEFIRDSSMPKDLADDLMQEALILLFTKIGDYDQDKKSLKGYVRMVTKHACLRYRRTYFSFVTADEGSWDMVPCSYSDELKEVQEILSKVEVSALHKEVVMLLYAGHNQESIAEYIGKSQSFVSKTIIEFREKYLQSLDN